MLDETSTPVNQVDTSAMLGGGIDLNSLTGDYKECDYALAMAVVDFKNAVDKVSTFYVPGRENAISNANIAMMQVYSNIERLKTAKKSHNCSTLDPNEESYLNIFAGLKSTFEYKIGGGSDAECNCGCQEV